MKRSEMFFLLLRWLWCPAIFFIYELSIQHNMIIIVYRRNRPEDYMKKLIEYLLQQPGRGSDAQVSDDGQQLSLANYSPTSSQVSEDGN